MTAKLLFSPKGGCEAAVVALIDQAKTSIYVAMFSFTSAPIAAALIRAHADRKVSVQVVCDKDMVVQPGHQSHSLTGAGIPVYMDAKHNEMHSKFTVVDEKFIAFGSFNYSFTAEHSNAEDLAIENNKKKAASFIANWKVHQAHSTLQPAQ